MSVSQSALRANVSQSAKSRANVEFMTTKNLVFSILDLSSSDLRAFTQPGWFKVRKNENNAHRKPALVILLCGNHFFY